MVSLTTASGMQEKRRVGSGKSEESLTSETTPMTGSIPGKLLSWALTFVMVNLGWAFFCMDLPTALFFLRRLFLG